MKIKKLGIRICIIYLVTLVIKGFDYSFGSFTDITFRGILFSIVFISIWLAVWYVAEYLQNKLVNKHILYRLIINIILGFATAFLINYIYYRSDVILFNNQELWQSSSLVNPEFTISLLLLYLIGYGISEYLQSLLRIKEEQLKSEKLGKEKALAHYFSLKAQIEPHFLFNSLSVLSSLVHTNANMASEFIVKLSKTLRYIIEQNEKALVSIDTELQVVYDYFFLIKTRFGAAIDLQITKENKQEVLIPPATLQMLVENAVKHNKTTKDKPLQIFIKINHSAITVTNNINHLAEQLPSTGVGLMNIKERYLLIANKEVLIEETTNTFTVTLPILTEQKNESSYY